MSCNTRDNDEFLREVLELVNKARTAFGLPALDKLPCGVRGSGCDCPLARALGGSVSSTDVLFDDTSITSVVADTWSTDRGLYYARLPQKLHAFVRSFDHGCFPDLEEPELSQQGI